MDEFEKLIYERLFRNCHLSGDEQARMIAYGIRKQWFVVSKKNIDIYFEEKK